MRTSIPSLVIGDVVQTNGFIGKVIDKKDFKDCTQVHLSYVSGIKRFFDILSNSEGFAVVQGNHWATVTLITVNFESE